MQRGTFTPHGIAGWYFGPAMTHYRYYTIYIPKTQGECIIDSVLFRPYLCDCPNITPLERFVIIVKDLTSALKHPHHNLPMLASRDNNDTLAALDKLAQIFRKKHSNKCNSTHQNTV